MPADCDRALDVGCGGGVLTAKLAGRARCVTGVDASASMIAVARRSVPGANVDFVAGDFLAAPLPYAAYDFIAAVAVVHHMALEAALSRMAYLLRPRGVLAVIGLARNASPVDYLTSAVSIPVARLSRARLGWWESPAPRTDPTMSYAQIRDTARALLPGVEVRRRLYFRHSLLWRKP